MKKNLLFLIVLVFLLGCAKEPQFVGIDNVVVSGVGDNTIRFSLDYKAYNPNNFNSRLVDAAVDIYYMDDQVGSGTQILETRLQKNDTISVPLNCSIQIDKITGHIPRLLAEKDPKFLIKGNGKVKVFPGKVDLDFEEEVTLNIRKELMKQVKGLFKIQNFFAIKEVGWQRSGNRLQPKMNATIDWTNSLPIDYKIISQDISIGLKGNRKPLSRVTSNANVEVGKNEMVTIPLTFEQIDLSSVIGSGLSLFLQKEAELWLDGHVVVEVAKEKIKVPVETFYKFKLSDLANLR